MSVDIATLSLAVDSRPVVTATDAMDRMADIGSGLEGVVKKIAAAWASWKVVEYAREAATLAARYETLGVVMGVVGNNAGYTRDQMDAYAASLTKAGISMVESRNSLAVMAQSHIDLAKAQQLGRLAQDAAVIGNLNSSQAFQTLIHGIQSGQTEILRTIGINVNFENSYKELGKTLHKNAQDLTEYEKTQARTNAVLAKAPDLMGAYEASMGTAGKQLLSMQRYSEDLQTVFGAIFSDAFGTVVQALNQALQETKSWLGKNAEAANTMKFALGSAAENFVGLVKDVLGIASDMSRFNDELSIGEILTGGLALAMAVVRDAVMAVVGVVETIWGAISTIISGATYGFTKLIGMVGGFEPPAWMKTFLDSSKGIFNSGGQHLQGGAISEFYNGKPFNVWDEVAKDDAREAAAKAEKDRIASGNKARADAEAKAKAEQTAAASAAAYTAALQHKVEVMKWEADAYNKSADAAEKSADAGIKDNLALQDFVTSLQPAQVEAEKMAQVTYDLGWALADGIINQREYNDLLDTAREKYTAAGQAAKTYKDKLESDAARLNQKDDYQTKLARLNEINATGKLSPEAYAKELHKLQLESNTVWGAMAYSIENFADRGSDALANFLNGTKTGFRDMVSSLLIDMEKLILKEQVVAPFLKGMNSGFGTMGDSGGWDSFASAFMSAWGGGKAVGGDVFSGTTYLVGERGPELFTPGRTGSITPNHALGGTTNTTQIIVNVASDGTATSKVTASGANAMAKEMQSSVEPLVLQILQKHMRPGGRLNPVAGGGIA